MHQHILFANHGKDILFMGLNHAPRSVRMRLRISQPIISGNATETKIHSGINRTINFIQVVLYQIQ